MRVEHSGSTDSRVELQLVTTDGSAKAGSDYIGGSFPAPIYAGYNWITLPIVIKIDSVAEDDETFTVSIRLPEDSPYTAGSDATVTIHDGCGPGFTVTIHNGHARCEQSE